MKPTSMSARTFLLATHFLLIRRIWRNDCSSMKETFVYLAMHQALRTHSHWDNVSQCVCSRSHYLFPLGQFV